MKHTPGPWDRQTYTVFSLEHGGWYMGEELLNNRFSLNVQGSRHVTSDELMANAKLIAAAPDLLDALLDMVSDHENLSLATIENARKAIQKAVTW